VHLPQYATVQNGAKLQHVYVCSGTNVTTFPIAIL
jgi:hypothetical protein